MAGGAGRHGKTRSQDKKEPEEGGKRTESREQRNENPSQQNANNLEGNQDASIPKSDRDGVVRQFEEHGVQWLIALLSEGDDDEAEQKVQDHVAALNDTSGSPKEQVDILETGSRRAAEAKRRDKVRQTRAGGRQAAEHVKVAHVSSDGRARA